MEVVTELNEKLSLHKGATLKVNELPYIEGVYIFPNQD